MAEFDFRQAMNALSDVVVNRPPPIRVFDQIYMKFGDMLLQTQLLSPVLRGPCAVRGRDGRLLPSRLRRRAQVR